MLRSKLARTPTPIRYTAMTAAASARFMGEPYPGRLRSEALSPVVVLGPERPAPMLPGVLDLLGVRGPVALISAGWRYDEERDEPLREAVGRPVKNLAVYRAFREVEREAPALVAAYTAKQDRLRAMKERYRAAITHAHAEALALRAQSGDGDCPWFRAAVQHLRDVDDVFLAEADRLHEAFAREARPLEHVSVRRRADAMRDALDACELVLVAGGHVGVLRNRLAFFGFDRLLAGRRIVAWSGGAMVLSERVLLYHDHTNYGVGTAEMLDRGLGLMTGAIFLPHAPARLLLDNPDNVAVLAHRLAPRKAIGLVNGAVLDGLAPHAVARPGSALLLGVDGVVRPLEEAHAGGP
jgi:hypothetical protein